MKIRDLLSSKVTRNASWIIAGRVYHMLLAFLLDYLRHDTWDQAILD